MVDFVKKHNDFFFNELGVKREACEKEFQRAMREAGIEINQKESFHRLAFAALAVSGFPPANILELGTNKGETSKYLSCLFPNAKIYTVELPLDDPLYIGETGIGAHMWPGTEDKLQKSIENKNIVSIRINTAFLHEQDFPKFDLIWVDAGHRYPEVAWDHFFCIQHLSPGGWLFSDDVYKPSDRPNQPIYEVIDYYNKRMPAKFQFLLKREDAYQFVKRPKYLAYFHKPK